MSLLLCLLKLLKSFNGINLISFIHKRRQLFNIISTP